MAEQPPLRPTTLVELEAIVADALAAGEAIEALGRGSKRGFGRPVEAPRLLTLEGLAGISMYEPEELVMSAGAGTPLAEIEAALAERGQELAFEPADYGAICGGPVGRQSIGGVLATNAAGPRRLKTGAARDHLLGVQCVTGRGQTIKTGGRVVKNVTGYDLCKLLAGSFGTLALMAHVTFKVLPRAETETTLLLSSPDESELLATLRAAMASTAEPSGAAYLPALAAGRSAVPAVKAIAHRVAVLRLEGPAPSVAYRADELGRQLGRGQLEIGRLEPEESRQLWREIRDVRLLTAQRPLWRLSLAPTHGAELAEWLGEMSDERLFDWAGGLVWLAPKPDEDDVPGLLRQALEGRGGHATLVRASLTMRREVPVFQPLPGPLEALTRRVKNSFDPQAILNPGRLYAGM